MITVLLALTGVAEATNVVVPTQYPTVSAAAAALVGPGPHTIQIVVDNTYAEVDTVDLSNMDVTVRGTGSANTIIRVNNPLATAVFVSNNGRLVLEDVTVTGDTTGQQTGLGLVDNVCSFADDRRGVDASSSVIEVYDSELRCFFSQGAGAGIRGITSDIIIDDSSFEQNIALGAGGHVYAGGSTVSPPTVNITDTEFSYGFAISDGGAISAGNVIPHVSNNAFRYNDAVVRGGAISVSTTAGTAEVWSNTFEQNIAYGDLTFEVFDFNDQFDTGAVTGTIDFSLLTGDGGAVYVDADSVDLWANLFCGNFADTGGSTHLESPALSVVENNVFADNWAIHYGGGLYLSAETGMAEPDVWNNTFYANSAGQTLPPDNQLVVYGAGGGAFFDGTTADVHNNIVSNQQFGGGVGGIDGDNYTIGDPLTFEYNLWFTNLEGFLGDADLTGDYAGHTLNQTNVFGLDPFPTFGNFGDLDCYPDAFYPEYGSPTIDRGDDTGAWTDVDGTRNDIGYTGGERAPVVDGDGDGYMNTIDCNDTDPTVNPAANETCDLQDNDCDGEVDEGSTNTWYTDVDGDGFGDVDPNAGTLTQCADPGPAYAPQSGDCDDTDPAVNPDAAEVCDDIDNDCDGTIDNEEILSFVEYYRDNDGDGVGAGAPVEECTDPGAGWSTVGGDCNDNDSAVSPNAGEVCDNLDNDCDGTVDIGASDSTIWYLDNDADGYGTGTGQDACDAPGASYIAGIDGDCDDNNPDANPAAAEICDGFDNNCDGVIDENPETDPDATTYYEDADGDGFLDEESAITLCPDAEVPAGFEEASANEEFDCDPSDETNTSEKCYGDCGCQTSPANGGTGMLALLAGLVLGLRRRQD